MAGLVYSAKKSVETNRSALICQLFLSYHFNQLQTLLIKHASHSLKEIELSSPWQISSKYSSCTRQYADLGKSKGMILFRIMST